MDYKRFADPAWDILLDLFVAMAEGSRVSVSSACIGSGVATSTAVRWVVDLERRGFVSRSPDPLDGRRQFLTLDAEAAVRIERWIEQTFLQ